VLVLRYRGARFSRVAQRATVLEPAPGRPADSPPHRVVIQPSGRFAALDLKALWSYRELFFFIVWRDVKVRYKQTAFGIAWAVLQPLLLMIVFSVFLGHLAKVGSEGFPYPVFAFAALIPWTFFAQSLAVSSDSLVANRNLIAKVYFPRLLLPTGVAASFLVDLVVGLVVLLLMMAVYGIAPTAGVILLPALVLLAYMTAAGVGLWLSALNVRYRDVRLAVPFLVQIWLFATPVAYPATIVPENLRFLVGLNPMAGVCEGFRWALLGTKPPGPLVAASVAVVLVLIAGGLVYFRKMERTFADFI
jgi:lipopolysaccharide transport system permease protein